MEKTMICWRVAEGDKNSTERTLKNSWARGEVRFNNQKGGVETWKYGEKMVII
jgi:hypothetical protein